MLQSIQAILWDFLREATRPGSTQGKAPREEEHLTPLKLSVVTDLDEKLGNPDDGKRYIERRHMVVARKLPGSWNRGSGRLYCNKLMEPTLRKFLALCEMRGCVGEITRLGCFNYRRKRHSSQAPWSEHARGAAIDINPAQNRPVTVGSSKVVDMEPWDKTWKALWPKGVSRELVNCAKEAGLKWGGDWRPWIDPMHFSLTGK